MPADTARLAHLVSVQVALGDTYRPVAATCAYAGLRISETLGLRWADLDLEEGTMRVERQLDDDLTLRLDTKTPASTATVRMLPALVRELRSWRTRQAASELRHGRSRSELVFTTMRGRPQSRRNALRAVHTAGDAAGLNPPGVERVGLHDLRHSMVGLGLAGGLSPVRSLSWPGMPTLASPSPCTSKRAGCCHEIAGCARYLRSTARRSPGFENPGAPIGNDKRRGRSRGLFAVSAAGRQAAERSTRSGSRSE